MTLALSCPLALDSGGSASVPDLGPHAGTPEFLMPLKQECGGCGGESTMINCVNVVLKGGFISIERVKIRSDGAVTIIVTVCAG